MHRVIAGLLLLALALANALAAAATVSGRVVDKDGKGIPQAVVFVNAPAGGAPATPPGTRATMDQVNKTFVPGVLPIVVGSEVRFPNHDQIQHHVYSFSRTKNFELPLYKGQDAPPVRFDRPGVVKVGCNIHDWMSAVILVVPTPYYAVTDAGGRFSLTGLPDGTHTLVAWHESSRDKLEATQQQVQVATGAAPTLPDGAAAGELTFTLALAPARARPAVRGLRRDQ